MFIPVAHGPRPPQVAFIRNLRNRGSNLQSELPAFLTIRELCDLLQVTRITAYRLARDGSVPAVRFCRHWRIDRRELEARLAAGALKPTPA